MAFQDKVLLVMFRSSQWGRNRFDRILSDETTNNHGMAVDAARVYRVLSLHPLVKAFAKHVSSARNEHYKLSLPWTDGVRIIRAARYRDYNEIAQGWVRHADDLYLKIYAAWPDIYAQAKADLAGAFDPRELPLREQLRSKYQLQITYQRMGAVQNWAIGLSEEEQRQLKAQAVEAYKDSVKAATEDLWHRLYERVRMIASTLGDPNKQIRRPLIAGLRNVLEMIPDLAITEITPELREQLTAAEKELLSIDIDNLKQDEHERKRRAEMAKDRLTSIQMNMNAVSYT